MPLEEVFELLRTSREGLSSDDAEARLMIFGPNKLEEKPVSTKLQFIFRNLDFAKWRKSALVEKRKLCENHSFNFNAGEQILEIS